MASTPRDPDSDNDGLNDRDELVDTRTKPHDKDSDGDTVSDFEEVVTYGGKYDPNLADTDGDGRNDGVEIALADSNGDYDGDALSNGAEGTHGTDPTLPDTDCDGVNDGPEWNYWGTAAPLLDADWDDDGLKDGIELGTVGTPSQALYRTSPGLGDTDGDGLGDNDEARNNVKVQCGNPATSQMAFQSSPIPMMPAVPAPSLTPVNGFLVGHDEGGWYVQGGYGVKLYVGALPAVPSPQDVVAALEPTSAMNTGVGTDQPDRNRVDSDWGRCHPDDAIDLNARRAACEAPRPRIPP